MSHRIDKTLSLRYARQRVLPQIGAAGQERLRGSRVTLVGIGALGCVQAAFLARAGVGFLRLVDRDVVETGNLQRQLLFTEDDAREGIPKAEAARLRLKAANPTVDLQAVVAHLGRENARELLSGSDVILDGTDNFDTRFLVNDFSIATGTPWIYGACVGTVGTLAAVLPGQTACLRCLLSPEPAGDEPTCETAGILGPAAGIVGSFQAAAAIRMLLEGTTWRPGGPLRIEAWSGSVVSLPATSPDPRCPACGEKRLEFLEGTRCGSMVILCGKQAVQFLPHSRVPRDLAAVERTLSRLGKVRRNSYLLRASLQGHDLSLFPDGRIIVFGTEDPHRARALVDRYLAGF